MIFDTIDIPDSNDETLEFDKKSQNKASFLLRPFISSLCFLTSTQQLTSSFLLLFYCREILSTYEDIRGIYLAFKGQIKRKTSFSHTPVQQTGHDAIPKKLNVNKMCTCEIFFTSCPGKSP